MNIIKNVLNFTGFNIIFGYPWWFVLICATIGLLFAFLLYYKSKIEYLTIFQKKLLAVFRFIVITVLCMLLLSPLVVIKTTNTDPPIVLLFQDNSSSLVSGRDSLFMQEEYPEMLENLRNTISKDFTIVSYVFGERTRQMAIPDFQDRITDMSDIFATINTIYTNRNVGAVIIAGDGIFNRGANPLYLSPSRRVPIYTIALGDTVPQRDLIINRIKHNTITYLGNYFPLEITVQAQQANGLNSVLKVWHNNLLEFEKRLSFNSDNHFETVMAQLEARETGIKRYRVEIEPIENEISTVNNYQDFYIEVIDSRQKVIILANSPHPDVGAIKLALENNDNYEVTASLLEDFRDNLKDFDVVIWHQLPSLRFVSHPAFEIASSNSIPQVFVLGPQSHLQSFNRLPTGVQITPRSAGTNDSRAGVNENFALFSISPELADLLTQLPPLSTTFANFNLSTATQVLLFQRIGTITTQYPLMAFTETGNQKTAVITGEGIWRWRLGDFARNANHNAFDELISKIVQYVSVVEDKSFFRVLTQNFLLENEQVIFDAELYNRSYELVNDPDVSLQIINEQGLSFDYVFGRTINAYNLNAGSFPPGEYSYRASVEYGQDRYTAEGIFSVSPLNIEGINTVADHQLLYQVAANSGGELFFHNQLEELANHIRSRSDIGAVLYSREEFKDIINLNWIFFLLLILLSVEWFVRKFRGGY
jgi:hypothetical protein